ncbi:hypothetical protein CBR_g34133 [Chara braunii]|uniref:Reverse transcriptase domain-containing protein n=1 Tax=Chara braunii TaxID=69332 RepID=A0A388LI06_CHABU|nr:hypothetical protein CBR_g34133 [Chara braunii]|eukprot:GBG81950.1 hypothetical protein CBR_g34133 [Chara braunii]
MNRLLSFVESQQLEAAEKKRVEHEKKRQEEEKQRVEEAKQREEAEKQRVQAIMEATAAQGFTKEMAALEEKIKEHVNTKITVSEEKNARLQDSLLRFLERTDGDGQRRTRTEPCPNPKRRLDLDGFEREADAVERSAATPVPRRERRSRGKGKSRLPEFKTKTTRRALKEKLAAVIKKKTGVNIRLKVSVGVTYSHKLKKRTIHDMVVLCVEKSKIHPVLKSVLRRRVRVVWRKNKTVEQTLTNHRKTAREETGMCTCSEDRLPSMEGHALTRIVQCPEAPTFLHNGKNILQSDAGVKSLEVQRAVGRSLGMVMRRELYQVAGADCFREIISDRIETRPACSEERARELAVKWNHLVVVPVDRNPRDLVIMCPATYHHGLQMMFNLNVAYRQVLGQSEKKVLSVLRAEFKKVDLDKLGAWNPAAKLGQAYVLPKHKDLTRWKPIAPANTEGSKTAGRRLARALNFLLEKVPGAKHFNLKATALLKQNLEVAGRRLSVYGEKSMALIASFDIQEMFTSLPHQEIAQVVDWLLQQWEMRGVCRLSLSKRGREVALSRKSPGPGYVMVKFSQIRQMVSYELENTYILCRKMILKQVVGIPMGKNSSPSLACVLCAKQEVDFLSSLGADQRIVHGVRLVDDVTVAIACDMDDCRSIAAAKSICHNFGRAYGEQLELVRTNDGTNSWDFLGTRVAALPGPITFAIRPKQKNEGASVDDPLAFRCFQDFDSYSEKRAKAGTVIAVLHKIKQHASDPSTGVHTTLSVSIELGRRGYPPALFSNALAAFARATGQFGAALKTLTEQPVKLLKGRIARGEAGSSERQG